MADPNRPQLTSVPTGTEAGPVGSAVTPTDGIITEVPAHVMPSTPPKLQVAQEIIDSVPWAKTPEAGDKHGEEVQNLGEKTLEGAGVIDSVPGFEPTTPPVVEAKPMIEIPQSVRDFVDAKRAAEADAVAARDAEGRRVADEVEASARAAGIPFADKINPYKNPAPQDTSSSQAGLAVARNRVGGPQQ